MLLFVVYYINSRSCLFAKKIKKKLKVLFGIHIMLIISQTAVLLQVPLYDNIVSLEAKDYIERMP